MLIRGFDERHTTTASPHHSVHETTECLFTSALSKHETILKKGENKGENLGREQREVVEEKSKRFVYCHCKIFIGPLLSLFAFLNA